MNAYEPLKLVIGAGDYNNNPGWLQTQESDLNLLNRPQWEARFPAAGIDAVVAEHVWEHLDAEEGVAAAKCCFDFLKPGGYVRCAVPDGYFPDEAYQRIVQVGGPGPADHPAASHRIVYTYRTLVTMFEAAGFQVKLLEYCDEQGRFHSIDWNEDDGLVYRSLRYDHRNADGILRSVSLIVDAVKPHQA
ncbi:methyltransferase domain-containing protein [Paenibacillus lycopersici]|uniref:Methyltransferase domain-containing protein n=1 Tax=Paenibacillus lycopersici TaxID=2704462 RepID=A0A6C0G0M6_9BACL|nr:methyltransferase domain-containing protein [Paenibacillus lycopersici]QHT61403.1 methyltransferase domain-containing protein [Paenibacillus lycopersici]